MPIGTYRVFFRLQTVCPTAIFNFPFSTFNLKKLSLGHDMFFYITNCLPDINFPFSILHLIKAVCTNWERRLAVSRIDFAVDLFYLCLDFAICSEPNAKINKEKNCTID